MTPIPPPPTVWLITGPILLLYVAAAALIYALREINERICAASSKEKPMPAGLILLLTAVSNLLAVASIVLAAGALASAPRLSMLAVPLALLLERYGRLIYRAAPRGKSGPVAALAGSVAGLAGGAWLFMRQAAGPEGVARVPLSRNLQTVPFTEMMKQDATWAVSLKLVGLYLLAVSIFFALHVFLKRAAPRLLGRPGGATAGGAALSVAVAFALNFMGVAALVLAANSSDVQARLAMVGFPLFLILEAYVQLLRKEPGNRPSHWTGLIGSSGGMVLAAFLLLRGAPLR